MNYGFAIDNRRCIGCHACSTACKAENDVPLGVYRTWVKYTETGTFPDTRRHFQVTRCNHCDNPPCARICPVTAMYQRADGIVEFDSNLCIGCKACMQACPYDAIHIDPETGTAAKCHYCAHRTDIGLEPACVVVCPEHAIVSGDLDDPTSELSRLISTQKVSVRKPEQGTVPKLFYIDGDAASMLSASGAPSAGSFMSADVLGGHDAAGAVSAPRGGGAIRVPGPQGVPSSGPITFGGRVAEHMVQVGYNAQHQVPWHWPVPAYLVTKGVSAGAFALLSLAWMTERLPFDPLTAVVGGALVQAFLAMTTALLVLDLERPERFLRILLRPQWKSWLTRGAFLLVGFAAVSGLWWTLEGAAWWGLIDPGVATAFRPWALGLGLPLAIGVAIYTAFLFGQAEGRDLWQSPLLPIHLMVQAILAGAAAWVVIAPWLPQTAALLALAVPALAASLATNLCVTLLGEFAMPHTSGVATAAARAITHGRHAKAFWGGALGLGHLVPLALLAVIGVGALTASAAAAAALVGLYAYEHVFVMAPQEVPNS